MTWSACNVFVSRIFDGDAFLVFRKKKEKVCAHIENAKDEKWNEEYEDLLSERN